MDHFRMWHSNHWNYHFSIKLQLWPNDCRESSNCKNTFRDASSQKLMNLDRALAMDFVPPWFQFSSPKWLPSPASMGKVLKQRLRAPVLGRRSHTGCKFAVCTLRKSARAAY